MKRPDYKIASVFTVKYFGPTNTRDSRLKITNRGKSKHISYDYRHNNTLDMAIEYLNQQGR